jgi:protein O-mannosyl-transferase
MNRHFLLTGLLTLVLLCGISYYPALRADFAWDDNAVTENALLRSSSGLARIWTTPSANSNEEHYWPVVYTVFWLQYQLWGANPFGYHLVNVLLHVANSIVVWFALRRMRIRGAWFAGALFAVHPVHVESVAWVIELKDVLSALFYLSAFLLWLGWLESRHRIRLVMSVLLFSIRMLTKSMIVTLPAAMFVYLWYSGFPQGRRSVFSIVPYVLLGTGFVVLDFLVMRDAGVTPPVLPLLSRVAIAGQALWFYAGKLVFPAGLLNIYPRWDPVDLVWLRLALPVSAVLVLAALYAARDRIGKAPFAAFAYYCVTLSPVLGLVSFTYMDHSFVADRFQYLALIGPLALFAAGAALAADWAVRKGVRRGMIHATAALPLALGVSLSIQHAARFTNSFTLLEHTLAGNPRAWVAHYNLGLAYSSSAPVARAEEHFRKAIMLKPADSRAYMGLGVLLLRSGRAEDALEQLNGALWVKPGDPELLYDAGMAYAALKRFDQAEKCFRRALAADPNLVNAHMGYGAVLALGGRQAEARQQFLDVLRLDPANATARRNLDALTSRTATGSGK